MMARIPLIIRVLISVLFLFSAIAKLYPSADLALSTFEAKQLWPMGFSHELAAYFSRGLIGVEFALGIAILQPHHLKKIIVPATIGLLAVFCVQLTYEVAVGAGGNCGCFGELMPMTPLEALIKNIISIGLLVYLMKLLPADTHKRTSYVLLIFTTIELFMFALAPVHVKSEQVISKEVPTDFQTPEVTPQLIGDNSDTLNVNTTDSSENNVDPIDPPEVPKAPAKVTSKYSKYVNYIPPGVKIDEGRKILCFFAPTCDHCMETAKILTEMREEITGFPPVHIVFMDEGPEEIPNFFKFAGREYSHSVADILDFWEMLGTDYDTPGVVYLWNGNQQYFADGIEGNAFKKDALMKAILK